MEVQGVVWEESLFNMRGTTTQHLVYLGVSEGNTIHKTEGQTFSLCPTTYRMVLQYVLKSFILSLGKNARIYVQK